MRNGRSSERIGSSEHVGRWPTNVVVDDDVAAMVGARFFYVAKPDRSEREIGLGAFEPLTGGASTDRVDGTKGLNSPRAGSGRTGGARNPHPTVKPIDLMRWLCRLVTPPDGVVLDPFCGSGTTGIAARREGFRFIGIDRDARYADVARARISGDAPIFDEPDEAETADAVVVRQASIFDLEG
jgi:site-specific DNA-methyltransferase (adenine-specific)